MCVCVCGHTICIHINYIFPDIIIDIGYLKLINNIAIIFDNNRNIQIAFEIKVIQYRLWYMYKYY